jgi:hypothetical protein
MKRKILRSVGNKKSPAGSVPVGLFFVCVLLTARIEDALLLQRRITAVTNNYVIKNRELDELGGFDEVLSGADVFVARCGHAGRVIMNKDN